jgi:cytochrome P450
MKDSKPTCPSLSTDNLQPIAPNHNFLFGHLLLLKKLSDELPKGAHYQYMFCDIARKHFTKEGAFYIDLWPMSALFLAVVSPNTAMQINQPTSSLASERPPLLRRFFKPIAGGTNLFDLPEKEWRPWRAVFNKGFSSEHVSSLVPGMVKETLVYLETLRGHAREGNMFFLDNMTLRFTMDMIGKTIL